MKLIKRTLVLLIILISSLITAIDGLHKIAIEGMPGAGKSTSLLELIGEFQDRCILLSETNPEPNAPWQDYSVIDQGDIFHRIWVTRMHLVDALSQSTPCVLFDRSYYSNLAYKFASDKYCKTTLYTDYLDIFKKDLKNKQFSLIIILDVTPEIGLARRNLLGDNISYPWTEVGFLKEFRNFYATELANFADCPIVTISTDNLTKSEVKSKIKAEIEKVIGPSVNYETHFPESIKNQILTFGKEKNLGYNHSQVVNVLGFPTIYFRQHSVQIHNGTPVFFNNQRLKEIIHEYTTQ
jgi:thymidylate kinase